MYHESNERDMSALVSRAVLGDQSAKGELIGQIRPTVVRYCRARLGRSGGGSFTTADDVAQEVCMAVMKALPRYEDTGRPFTAFVFGIAAHKVADAHRSATRNMMQPYEDVPDIAAPADRGPEAQALAWDSSQRMQTLLSALPETHRNVIILRVVEGLSAEDAGRTLSMSAGAVRVTQHRALTRLRQLLSKTAEVTA
ncbi:MAG TPA: RNA polymerase sigma factor ShbA [Mycobacteriales bacterium]|jgi:RNA polymerase sigma-70 factor (ECF subfamily)|nr:RNA polymerase sigma factor ShbA [Mycobacteriales bacterium]